MAVKQLFLLDILPQFLYQEKRLTSNRTVFHLDLGFMAK
jgi:hypothetical protein